MEHIEITYESHERLQLDNTKEATDGTDVFCLSRACPPIDCKSYTKSDLGHQLQKMAFRRGKMQKTTKTLAHRHQHARSELHKLQNSRHLVSTDRKSKRQSRTASPRPGAKIHPAEPASDSMAPGGPPGPIKNAPSGTAGECMDTASYTACVSYMGRPADRVRVAQKESMRHRQNR